MIALANIPVIHSILEVICRSTGMRLAAVAKVTDKKWLACAVLDQLGFGLEPGGKIPIENTICNEIRKHHNPVVIEDVAADKLFCGHPALNLYGFKSYISVPIFRRSGQFFGTLCAIDRSPAFINTPEVLSLFKLCTELISFHIEAVEKLDRTETKLAVEHETAQMREEFVALLSHDLKNPLIAVTSVARLLLKNPEKEDVQRLASMLLDTSHRMNKLVETVLDFAKVRLGSGLSIDQDKNRPVDEIITQVIKEFSYISPDLPIQLSVNLSTPVLCDGVHMSQLFSNLIGNALTHGDQGTTIMVEAKSGDGIFEFRVINRGEKLTNTVLNKAFKPFYKGEAKSGGLGLGLYIASEIAKAYGGNLEAESDAGEIRFTFTMPI